MSMRTDDAPSQELLNFADGERFATILADPPWRFTNRTGKMAPEHKRLSRYGTMILEDIFEVVSPKWLTPGRICIYGYRMRWWPRDWKS